MKYIIPIILIAVVGAGFYGASQNKPVEVMNEKKEIQEVEVQPEWQTDEDAIKAAQAVIDRKRTEAELKSVQGQIEALEATYKAEMAALVEQETNLEKELGSY